MSLFLITVNTNRFAMVGPVPIREFHEITNKLSCEKAPASPCIPKGTVFAQLDSNKSGCFCTNCVCRMLCQNCKQAPSGPLIALPKSSDRSAKNNEKTCVAKSRDAAFWVQLLLGALSNQYLGHPMAYQNNSPVPGTSAEDFRLGFP